MTRSAFAGRAGLFLLGFVVSFASAAQGLEEIHRKHAVANGVAILIDPTPETVQELARAGQAMIKVQCSDAAKARLLRQAPGIAALLGTRVFIDLAPRGTIAFATNGADLIISPYAAGMVPEAEVLRALCPGGKAIVRHEIITKPLPAGTDTWSHPYHAPDNNTQSTDQAARWPYLTQFLAEPLFSSQPEVTVAAGGRVFKAFGHMTFRAYQNASINQLFAISAFNGSMLWKKELKPGFMIHRNTIIATPDILYMGDNESCKLLDAATGNVTDQIIVPDGISDGPVWKWMAIKDGVLYALVGAAEVEAPVAKGTQTSIGGWPWGMWPGYDYADPKTAWGFGRTLIAIELKTKKLLWHHRDENYIDSRGTCMAAGKIFFYSPDKFLAALDTSTGKPAWKTSDPALLAAIGPNKRAQHYITGFSTSVYLRSNGKVLMFAGPQRSALVAISADDGTLAWQKKEGNFQLVLRENALYALGQQGTKSFKLDYGTGNVLAEFSGRRACTRATGSIDSVFCRAQEGTIRWDLSSDALNHLAPMRPACHDGVIISDGQLFWGPWICGCHLTLVGIIGAGPAGDFDFNKSADESRQLEVFRAGDVKEFKTQPNDWSVYLGDNARSGRSNAKSPAATVAAWEKKLDNAGTLTAPVIAGGLAFVGGTDGTVRALDAATGEPKWLAHTGASIFFPPAIAHGRVYVGSNDGHVYAFEASNGEPLWRFRVAPHQRDIPVYGQIMSTWPVAGGVVVADDTLYAAAGISHFDGTHVCALDAITGKLKWHNNAAGSLDPQVKNGISVCGPMRFVDEQLSFPGGNVYPIAQFDARTGKCLNTPAGAKTSKRMFLFPRKLWEPVDLAEQFTAKGALRVNNRGPRQAGVTFQPDRQTSAKPWTLPGVTYGGSISTSDTLIALVRPQDAPWQITALNLADGTPQWKHQLPANPVHWGLAMDAAGRILVTTEDGRMICFAGK